MSEPVLFWIGWLVLLLLCLPFASTRNLLLEVSGWGLRLGLLALLAGGAVLWFRPDMLPAEVGSFFDSFTESWDILPSQGSPNFGMAVAMSITLVLLPLLALFDVTRKLARESSLGRREMADSVPSEPVPVPVTQPAPVEAPAVATAPVDKKRPDRRAAADAMAGLGLSKPFRVSDHVS